MKKRIILSFIYFISVHTAYFTIISTLNNSTAKHLLEIVFYFIAILIFCKALNINLINDLKRMKNDRKKVLYWIIVGFVTSLIVQLLLLYIKKLVLGIVEDSLTTKTSAMLIKQNILAIISPILIAPIFEELVFRKVIFKEIHKRYPFWFAGSISAILFAVLHADMINLLLYYIVGMILAFVYKKSGNIIIPIIIHLLLNAIPTLTILFSA